MPANPHPDDLREAVRAATYPNRMVEDETIGAVDTEVFDRVRLHERHIVENADALMSEAAIHESASDDIATALRNEIRYPLDEGALPNVDIARRFQLLRSHAETAIAQLERAEQQAEWLARKADDPHGDLSRLWKKWPLVRPTIGS